MTGVPRRLCLLLTGAAVLAAAPSAEAYMRVRGPLPQVGGQAKFADSDINVIENLGQTLPAGLAFIDGHGKTVLVDSLLGQSKPVLVTLGYYRCPLLCNLVHQGLAKGLKAAGLLPGRDFLGLAVSVDPSEDPKSAVTNQRQLLRALDNSAPESWPFLMPAPGAEAQGMVKKLADAVGFRYKYDEKSKQFAHAAVAFVLTPEGKISRYLYGVDFSARDLRLAFVEASGGRVGTTLDRVLLTCFKYDPMTQRYTPYVFGFVRIGALLSAGALATLLIVLWRKEWLMRRARREALKSSPNPAESVGLGPTGSPRRRPA
jgi:protein SCO1/2